MGDKEDYLTSYRVFFENFAATVNPEDQLPVHIAGYTITEAELPGEVLYWTTQYLIEKQCPQTLMTPLRRIILDEVQVASKKQPNDFGYKSDDSVYIALRLMQAVTARVIGVCLRYLDNSKLDSLPPPPPLTQRDMKTVSCATKNSRRVMEDRHVEIGNLEALFGIDTTEKTSFYAVYDGHAGSAAATYCAAHLHQYLVESPHFSGDLGRAMRDAFLRTDAEFIRKSNQERACGGSTAVAVAVRARQLLAAWAGDSQALLAKRMRLMQLVRPHKPGRQDERERIESSGGTVMFWGTWRVNGQLAVSRAIGDAQYKPYVTARPEIATVDLDGDEDFVVVACDGLWDFVSEDDVALAVYRQLAVDPDDLKAVTRHLIVQAKRQGSADNISIIVVFLKDPRDIAADNCPPMELGLDNALANPPPFAMEAEACKRQLESSAAESVDNDNSDSDSDDLGPETAVDVDDVDADRNHEPAPPTPPAHTVEEGHIDGALLDNVAESGEESEDEWNYYKGEGEREEQNPSDDLDEPPRSETPCQDNSAWETSSVDMNSSPLNPDAPVFIPGSVTGSDVLLAESPRKPVPMDDIELPDVAQFETEAVVRPAELLDLDNCDQLNGHHNVSINETGNLNGNEKCNMDSLGFGFNVGKDTENVTNTDFIQDFERIQKDTTDFCNIQVFQTHSETNPFASDDNDALLERLKNKERDPMSMSFYQEKDDDTCERLNKNTSHVDLNAVQTLPDSDDEDIQSNGIYDALNENDKENVLPDKHTEILPSDIDIQEPNNDIMRFDCRPSDLPENDVGKFEQGDNFIEYNVDGSNIQNYPNLEFESSNVPQDTVLQTDTPESHKLLFEQIPEIPDGKSSELGFTNEDLQDPSESEKDTRAFTPQDDISQDVDMESKPDISPDAEIQLEFKEDLIGDVFSKEQEVSSESQQYPEDKDNEIVSETVFSLDNHVSNEQVPESLLSVQENEIKEATTPDLTQDIKENVVVDVHHTNESNLDELGYDAPITDDIISEVDIKLDSNQDPVPTAETPLLTEPLLSQSIQLSDSPLPSQSPVPSETLQSTQSPIVGNSPIPSESLYPLKSPVPESPLPSESALSPIPVSTDLAPEETTFAASTASPTPGFAQSPITEPELAHAQSPVLSHSPTLTEKELRDQSPLPAEVPLPRESPLPVESPLPAESPLPVESSLPIESSISREEFVPVESPSLVDHAPTTESSGPESALRLDTVSPHGASPLPDEFATNIVDFDACRRTPAVDERLAPEIPSEQADAQSTTSQTASGPTPDLLPPIRDDIEQQTHSELVTDIDIEQLESRAQEICVPVTNEIYTDDSVLQPTSSPAPSAPQPDAALVASPLKETQIAADVAPDVQSNAAPVAIAAAAAVVGATAAVAATAKSKTPAKKSPTTPTAKADGRATKLASKPAASPRTPASATKKPTTTTPTAKAATTPTSRSATAPARASTTPSSRPATAARTAAKPATPGTKTTAPAAKPATAPTRSAAPRTTAAAPKPTAAREPTAKTAASTRAAPAAKPALPRTAAARPAPRPAAARPAPPRPAAAAASAAPKPKEAVAKPKVTEKKPLTNGDAKDASRAPPRAASRPPAARPAPRPGPRAAPAPAPPKTAVPKPAPRAPVTTKPLDKQTKDLANKRITAKAAPPRTAATKAPTNTKSTSAKPVPKKPVESPKKEIVQTNGLTNGALEPELTKPPPSPPAADNALLPDVIA